MHRLLARQIKRVYGSPEQAPEAVRAFFCVVEAAYRQADDDRMLLERSLEHTSDELVESNRRLHQQLADLQRMEIELRQSQKLEAVGQLAAGIAHEINTPIQFVGDSVTFLRDAFGSLSRVLGRYRAAVSELGDDAHWAAKREALHSLEEDEDLAFALEEIGPSIDRTLEGAARVASIVRAMKMFAHPDSRQRSSINLNESLASTLLVARNELKYVADVVTEFGDVPPLLVHAGDLNSVFLNLLVNAAHAIAEAQLTRPERGRISVRTEVVDGWVSIYIGDTGSGIAPEIRNRVFDPFFTTKEVGRGTGQGLAIARSIVVDKHGGTIDFESEVGVGTTFRIRLPLTAPPDAREDGSPKAAT